MSSVFSAPRSRVISRAPITASSSERCGSASEATTSTSDPNSTSVSATEKPVTPSPSTATLSPRQSACQLVSAAISSDDLMMVNSRSAGQPLEVEEPDAERDEQSGDDPEAHHDRHLHPPLHLEVVVKRARTPDAPALGELEVRALQDHRHGDDDEEATNEDEEQFGAGQDRQRGERPTEGESSGVPHHDLGWRRVPPEEADEGADDGGGDGCELERAGEFVALVEVCLGQPRRVAPLRVLPEADDHVGPDGEDGGARGEAVQAIGQVHRVRDARGDDDDPGDHGEDADDGPEDHQEVEPGNVPHQRHRGRHGRIAVLVLQVEPEHREDDTDDHGADDLPDPGEAEAVLSVHLHVVVDESDDAETDHHQDDQHRREGRRLLAKRLRQQVAEDGSEDEDDTAHRGGTALDHVSRRRVSAKELTEVHLAEQSSEHRGEQQGEDQREPASREQDDHRSAPLSRSARASRLECSEDFTSTTSRGRNSSRKRSYASALVSTRTDSPSQEPSSPAALWICLASCPTTTSFLTFSRTTSLPMRS